MRLLRHLRQPLTVPVYSGFSFRGFRGALSGDRLSLRPFGLCIKPGATIPVRVTGRIVAILTGQSSIRPIIQVAVPPRAPHASGVRPIEAAVSRQPKPLDFLFGNLSLA